MRPRSGRRGSGQVERLVVQLLRSLVVADVETHLRQPAQRGRDLGRLSISRLSASDSSSNSVARSYSPRLLSAKAMLLRT